MRMAIRSRPRLIRSNCRMVRSRRGLWTTLGGLESTESRTARVSCVFRTSTPANGARPDENMAAYVIQENEWLLKIAEDHGFRTEQPLLDANPELAQKYAQNPNVLPPGVEIEIPDVKQKTESAATGAFDTFV